MLKWSHLILVCCFFISPSKVYPIPTNLDMSRAASEIYRPKSNDILNYTCVETAEFGGFKVGVFHSDDSPDRIIALRGSVSSKENWCFNACQIGCANYGDGGNSTPEDAYNLALDQLTKFFYKHQNKHTVVCGHSLGGFLAQYFAKKFYIGGASFNAPALGNFDLRNDKKAFIGRLISLTEQYAKKGFFKAASPFLCYSGDLCHLGSRSVSDSIDICGDCLGLEFSYRRFRNHRLEGDPVSQINQSEDPISLGFYGDRVTHQHGFWNQMYTSGQLTLRLHAIDLFVEHLEENDCDKSACSGSDSRSTFRQGVGYLFGIR